MRLAAWYFVQRRNWGFVAMFGLALLTACASSQRVDTSFRPVIDAPAYRAGLGPVIWIDEGHNNILTVQANSRYRPFVATLRADGYSVRPFMGRFTPSTLEPVGLLVIGNALHARNVENWSLPTPSAFTADEIAALRSWVQHGGRLLFLFDHMPIAGAATELGAALGLEILNGLVEDPQRWDPAVFRRADRTLADHAITGHAPGYAPVETAATFDGAAFRAAQAAPLLILGAQYVSYQTSVAWRIDPTTPQVPVGGWLQGAVLEIGSGRVVVFSDATMFSAQVAPDGSRLGMNTTSGGGNLQLLRNTVRWLVH